MEVTSTENFMEASVEAPMEHMEELKASTDVTSTAACTKAPTNTSMEATTAKSSMKDFMQVMDALADVFKAFTEVTFTGALMESWKLPWKIWKI